MNILPTIEIDALALTLKGSLKFDARILQRRFISLSRNFRQQAFATNRYKQAIRIPIDSSCVAAFDSSKPWLLVQIDPKNAANDSPLQVELKSFPYSNKHFELVGETVKYLLDYKGLISSSELTVTRFDLAIDIQGELSKVLIHKSKTRVTETSYGRDGKLRCIRLGRSRSKRYVVVYGKEWRESRTTKVIQGNKLRIEMRCRPRVSLSDIIVSLNLQSFLSSIYLYDLKKVRSSNVLDSQTLRLCKHQGKITNIN